LKINNELSSQHATRPSIKKGKTPVSILRIAFLCFLSALEEDASVTPCPKGKTYAYPLYRQNEHSLETPQILSTCICTRSRHDILTPLLCLCWSSLLRISFLYIFCLLASKLRSYLPKKLSRDLRAGVCLPLQHQGSVYAATPMCKTGCAPIYFALSTHASFYQYLPLATHSGKA
jgi:hypothetical protein